MKIDTAALPQMIVEGARLAYYLDNPWAANYPKGTLGISTFEQWLVDALQIRARRNRNEIVDHLHELCRRACEGESRIDLQTCSLAERDAVILAYRALEGVAALERLALLGSHCDAVQAA